MIKLIFIFMMMAGIAEAGTHVMFTDKLQGGDTSYIQNTQTIQTGSTFFASSGTVTNQLNIMAPNSHTNDLMVIYSSATFGFYRDPATLNLASHTSKDLLVFQLDNDNGSSIALKRTGFGTANELDCGQTSVTGGMTTTFSFFPGLSHPYADFTSISVNSQTQPPVNGTMQLGSFTASSLSGQIPTASGQQYYCSNCSNALTCISTGTTTGAYASEQALNRTTACN